MKKYYYFVSCFFVDSRDAGATGMFEIDIEEEITSYSQIMNLKEQVKNTLASAGYSPSVCNTVIILNYILLRVEEE